MTRSSARCAGSLTRLSDATAALVFGYLATRNDMYATKALMLVHAWFIQDSTMMQPGMSSTGSYSALIHRSVKSQG